AGSLSSAVGSAVAVGSPGGSGSTPSRARTHHTTPPTSTRAATSAMTRDLRFMGAPIGGPAWWSPTVVLAHDRPEGAADHAPAALEGTQPPRVVDQVARRPA